MTTYVYTSLYGTEDADVLAYSSTYDPDQDTVTTYSSLYGLGGDDTVQITSDDYRLYVDAGEGNDRIIGEQSLSPLPSVTVHGGAGDDVVEYSSNITYNRKTKLDGGDGNDTLILSGNFDASRMTGFETLVVHGSLFIVNGQLSDFGMVEVEAQPITFDQSADLTGVHFSDSEKRIVLNGSKAADNFDLTGQSRDFSITGNGGADVIIAGAGRLFADAGAGIDDLVGGNGDDILNAGGRDKAAAAGAMETVLGMGGDDIVLFVGARAEYDGGEGVDVFKLATNTRHVIDLADSSVANFEILQLESGSTLLVGSDFLNGFEKITGAGTIAFADSTTLDHLPAFSGAHLGLQGSDGDDSFTLKDVSAKIVFSGGGGNDLYQAGATAVNLSGGDGNDRLFGSSATDAISGDAGDDQLVGGAGNDSLLGKTGNDTLFGGDGADTLDGGNGLDILHGGAGNDHLQMEHLTASDNQTLDGGAGNDHFVYGSYVETGGDRPWILHEAAKIDVLGGAGEDSLVISGNLTGMTAKGVERLEFYDAIWATPEFLSGFDKIDAIPNSSKPEAYIHLASPGKFTFSGPDLNAVIYAANGNNVFDFSKAGALLQSVYFGNGDDTFRFGTGGSGDNEVIGGDGNDTAYSGKGDDQFDGGTGNDVFVAGGGDDIFMGSGGNDTYVAANNTGTDRFEDFQNQRGNTDVIDLSGISDIKNFQDLMDHHIKTDASGEVYIDMGVHGKLFFTDVDEVGRLTEANFHF